MTEGQQAAHTEEPVERPALPEINQVTVAGRLVNALKIKDYGPNKNRAQFTLVVPRASRNGNGKPGVHLDYLVVVAWRDVARQCEGLAKGDAVQVQGRIRTWTDKTNRFHWEIEADTMHVLDRQPQASEATSEQQEPTGA